MMDDGVPISKTSLNKLYKQLIISNLRESSNLSLSADKSNESNKRLQMIHLQALRFSGSATTKRARLLGLLIVPGRAV